MSINGAKRVWGMHLAIDDIILAQNKKVCNTD